MKKHYADPFVPVEPVDKKNPAHYVNNKEFYNAVVEYRTAYYAALENGTQKPQISNYIGECIWKIAKGLAQKHNFRNYSYIDDMVSTAVEACIANVHMFNPEKSQNPFAYFTQSCYYAFLHIIKLEKKETSKKRRMILSAGVDTFELQEHDEDGEFALSIIEYIQGFTDDEPVEVIKQKTEKPGGLEGLFE